MTIRAVDVTRYGGPEALHVLDLPEPPAARAVEARRLLDRGGPRGRLVLDLTA
jgi:hypothetical protein